MTTSSDGILTATTDPATASVKLTVAFSGYVAAYNRITVTRADGTIVRGLDSAVAPGGMTKGYDHTAARGVAQIYTAHLINGVVTVASATATATIADDGTAWLKCLSRPALSVQLSVHRYPEWERAQPMAVLGILNGQYPGMSGGTRRARAGTMQVNTRDRGSRGALDALLEAQGAGPYFLQPSALADEPDCYVAIGTDTQARPYAYAAQPRRITALPMHQVARPPTVGSTVTIPGKTYGDSTAAMPWYFYLTGTYGSQS